MPTIASCQVVPCPHLYTQEDIVEAARNHFRDKVDFDRYGSVFETTGIQTRRFIVPLERLAYEDGWLDRSSIFAEEAPRLGEEALKGALDRTGLAPEDLGHLFFVTTSGIAAPSVDARILGHAPWSQHTQRTPMWGLGCAGGVSGLARAADWVTCYPDKAAAVLAVEFCSLTFLPQDFSLSNFVAAALFADGVACAVVVGDKLAEREEIRGFKIHGHRVRIFQDSLDIMGWNPVGEGLQVVFSRRIPSYVRENAQEEFQGLTKSSNVDPDHVTAFLGHPGGPKVLRAYEKALGWSEERFRLAWSTLAEYGNLSSVSVLHVLAAAFQEVENYCNNGDYQLVAALGPGFSSEQLLVNFS